MALGDVLATIDRAIEQRIALARDHGELPRDVDVRGRALLASATLHSLAVRARAGTDRTTLEQLGRAAARLLARGCPYRQCTTTKARETAE